MMARLRDSTMTCGQEQKVQHFAPSASILGRFPIDSPKHLTYSRLIPSFWTVVGSPTSIYAILVFFHVIHIRENPSHCSYGRKSKGSLAVERYSSGTRAQLRG